MQPYTSEFSRRRQLKPQTHDIPIGGFRYRADITADDGWVLEHGPGEEKRYKITSVLGGKNVYYFLTPLERGRLQVLAVAYDVRKSEWFDTAASGVRHFPDITDEALDWKDRAYTFNTSCYNCHVSQMSSNYDPKTDTYRTAWAEPGINCETCHGPAEDHNTVCRKARQTPKGQVPREMKIIRGGRDFTREETNDTCAPCHARMVPITADFSPGDRFFDHYDLVTLEQRDFYPDGRDLGENYTYTLWRMSPCARSGKLDCLHCHIQRAAVTGSRTPRLITPLCPARCDRPGWAGLIDAARKQDWSRLPDMLNYLTNKDRNGPDKIDEISANSLIRLLRACEDERKWPVILKLIKDPSPLVRASAAEALASYQNPKARDALLPAVGDDYRLVRIRAAAALSSYPGMLLKEKDQKRLETATGEYVASLLSRPDDWTSHYNLGNYFFNRGDLQKALSAFEAALKLEPRSIPPLLNTSLVSVRLGQREKARALLERALEIDPENPDTNFNLGLLKAENNDLRHAEHCFRVALKADPALAEAAYNLGILLAQKNCIDEACQSP